MAQKIILITAIKIFNGFFCVKKKKTNIKSGSLVVVLIFDLLETLVLFVIADERKFLFVNHIAAGVNMLTLATTLRIVGVESDSIDENARKNKECSLYLHASRIRHSYIINDWMEINRNKQFYRRWLGL